MESNSRKLPLQMQGQTEQDGAFPVSSYTQQYNINTTWDI
jgi:hypothetical protein